MKRLLGDIGRSHAEDGTVDEDTWDIGRSRAEEGPSMKKMNAMNVRTSAKGGVGE